jgi:hypothetical protein
VGKSKLLAVPTKIRCAEVLRASQTLPTLDEAAASQPTRLQSRSRPGEGIILTDKLNILVRVDLDHARAQVLTKGHVTVHSIQALYVVVKRANSLKEGLNLELDMRAAHVDPEAMEQLRMCSRTHHLPARIDPSQSHCTLRVLPPTKAVPKVAHQLAA